MRRPGIMLLALTLAAGPSAGQTRPAPTAPAKTDRKDPQAEAGVPPRLVEAAGESFVKVRYHFKKDLTEEAGRKSWGAWRARMIEQFVDDKIPLDAVGVVVAPATVLVYDNGLEDRFLDRIEVETASGKRLGAKREGQDARAGACSAHGLPLRGSQWVLRLSYARRRGIQARWHHGNARAKARAKGCQVAGRSYLLLLSRCQIMSLMRSRW